MLDFMNSTDVIQESFADYYKTTILADETDPDKLHDLKAAWTRPRSIPTMRSTTWCAAT